MSHYILKYFFCIIALLCSLNSMAISLVQRADSAYESEDYRSAVELYNNAAETEGVSSDLYYNLGNAYYRCGKISQSILAYERALRLDPTNTDARINLDFVNSRIVDKKGETGSFISNTIEKVANAMHSNTWAWIALVMFAVTIGCIAAYFFSGTIILKKLGFFGGIIVFILSLVAIFFSFKSKSIAMDPSQAIITSETTVLSTVPRKPMTRDEEAMLLHEGTKVRVLRSISVDVDTTKQTWHEVEIDNKHRAWINDADIEKIAI